jgi:Leucine-rich repeat (LRR) protein
LLGLKNNRLESLPNEIGSLNKLQWLNLEQNEIHSLPPDFKNLSSLNYLNLSKNKLEAIPDQVFALTKLNILLISNNLVKHIKDDEIMGLSMLQKVDLKENPFLKKMKPEILKQLFSINNFILNDS